MSFPNIPVALLSVIFSWLDFPSYYRLSRTNKELDKAANSSSLYEVWARELVELKCPPCALRWVGQTTSFIANGFGTIRGGNYVDNPNRLEYLTSIYARMCNLTKLDIRGTNRITINNPEMPCITSAGYFNISHLIKLQRLSASPFGVGARTRLPETLHHLFVHGTLENYVLPQNLQHLEAHCSSNDIHHLIPTLTAMNKLTIHRVDRADDVPVPILSVTELSNGITGINKVVVDLKVGSLDDPVGLLCFPNVKRLELRIADNKISSLTLLTQLSFLEDLHISLHAKDPFSDWCGSVFVLFQALRDMQSLRTITIEHIFKRSCAFPDMGHIKVVVKT